VTFADPQVKISKHKKYTQVSIKKDKSSSNILYNDYEEDLSSGRPIWLPNSAPSCNWYMFAVFASHCSGQNCVIMSAEVEWKFCLPICHQERGRRYYAFSSGEVFKVYLRDVVSSSEARSWFKLGRGSVYAIFLCCHRENLGYALCDALSDTLVCFFQSFGTLGCLLFFLSYYH
jgi:hypothetical protein